MSVCIYNKTAHCVVCRWSHDSDTEQFTIQLVVAIFINCTDSNCGLMLSNTIAWLLASKDVLVICFDICIDCFRISCHVELFHDLAKFISAGEVVYTTFNIFCRDFYRCCAFILVIWIWVCDCCLCICDFHECTLNTVVFNTILKFTKRQNIAFSRFVYESFTSCRVDVNTIQTITECQVTIVYPGDWHHLCEAKTCCISTGCRCHCNTGTLQRRTVCCLCTCCDVGIIPVFVFFSYHGDVSCITTSCQDNTLVCVSCNLCAIIHNSCNTCNLAIFNDEVFSSCTCHDLVAFNRVDCVESWFKVCSPVAACIDFTIAIHIAAKVDVFSVPKSTDQSDLSTIVEYGTLIFQPCLQVITFRAELRYQIIVTIDPGCLIVVLS